MTGTAMKRGSPNATIAGIHELEELRLPFISGYASVGERKIPVAKTRLSARDVMGGWKVRWDIGRRKYRVLPGLYAIGAPTPESPVLVTANYKLTFDRLRVELSGMDAWVLVLDTKGINVWCAAGKGTFGTNELVAKIAQVKLDEVVSHKRLILPQLGAPGVSAPEVGRLTGYRISYGPVRAADIPAFIANGGKKDQSMRRVRFLLHDRMAIAPTELVHSLPVAAAILAASALLALPFNGRYIERLLTVFLPYLGAILMGTLVFPALLPVIPFRPFLLKGALLGVIWGIGASLAVGAGALGAAAITLISAPIVSFIAMNFTGSSTFTCQTGAELEVKRGLIPMAASLVIGVGLRLAQRFLGA
jgi:hypothetical protein